MQASDLRVVRLTDTGFVLDADDEQNKAIFVAERMTFAYTGHARIADEDTADFFQGVIAASLANGRSVEDALAMVGTMCAGYFRALSTDTDRHHAFVGVGWDGQPPHDGPPFIIWASNAMDEPGEWLPDPREHFSTYYRRLAGDEKFALVPAGAKLPEVVLSRLNAEIAFLTGDGDDPAAVALVLIEAIREQAAENDAVGSGEMVNCIPRSPGPPGRDIMFVGDAPKLDVRTFAHVPADAVPTYEHLGPSGRDIGRAQNGRLPCDTTRSHGCAGPTLVSVSAADNVSGLADGVVEKSIGVGPAVLGRQLGGATCQPGSETTPRDAGSSSRGADSPRVPESIARDGEAQTRATGCLRADDHVTASRIHACVSPVRKSWYSSSACVYIAVFRFVDRANSGVYAPCGADEPLHSGVSISLCRLCGVPMRASRRVAATQAPRRRRRRCTSSAPACG
jgi:hypothetical protein